MASPASGTASPASGTKRRRVLSIVKPEVTLCGDLVVLSSHETEDLTVRDVEGNEHVLEGFWRRKEDGHHVGRLDTRNLIPGSYTLNGLHFMVVEPQVPRELMGFLDEIEDDDVHSHIDSLSKFAQGMCSLIRVKGGFRPATTQETQQFARLHMSADKIGSVIDMMHTDTGKTVYCTPKHEEVFGEYESQRFTIANSFLKEISGALTRWLKTASGNTAAERADGEVVLRYSNGDNFRCVNTQWVLSPRNAPYSLVAVWCDDVECQFASSTEDETLSVAQSVFGALGYHEASEAEISAFIDVKLEHIETSMGSPPNYWTVRDLMAPYARDMQIVRCSDNYPHEWHKDAVAPTYSFYGSSVGLVWRALLSVSTNRNFHIEKAKLIREDGTVSFGHDIHVYPQSLLQSTRLVMVTAERVTFGDA